MRCRLAELNDSVAVDKYTSELTEAFVRNYDVCFEGRVIVQVVVLADYSYPDQLRIAGWVREFGGQLVCASVVGVFGRIFVDFGGEFIVTDSNGDPKKEVFHFLY